MRRVTFSLSFKLLLIGEFVLLVAVITLLWPLRREMREQVIRDLQNEVRSIAVTAALQIDGEALKNIRTRDDAQTAEFTRLRRAINRVRVVNDLDLDQIQTWYRDGRDAVRLGVIARPMPPVGDPAPMRPEMRIAFDFGYTNVTDLYADASGGEFISAFAPIRDAGENVIAVLEVKQPLAKYMAGYHNLTRVAVMTALSVLLLSSMLGWLVLNRVVIQPMKAVRAGMIALGRQDFSHRVELRTRDEFQDLAETLNHMSEQLNVARAVQMSFFPKDLPRHGGYRIAAATEPCEATAGDYVDAFELGNDRVAILVADVTGHGLGPSLLMSACRSALRALATADLPPSQIIAKLDALLENDLTDGRFITMIFGVLDGDGAFTYTNAGHGPAMVVMNGDCQVLLPHRTPLGVGLDFGGEAKQSTIRLRSGDRVFLCSDGVSEAMDATGDQFGMERLATIVGDISIDQDQIVQRVRDAIRKHTGTTTMKDDVTILCVDRIEIPQERGGEPAHEEPQPQSISRLCT